jgi:hypothetical protein
MSQMMPRGMRKKTTSQNVPGSASTQKTSRFSLQLSKLPIPYSPMGSSFADRTARWQGKK